MNTTCRKLQSHDARLAQRPLGRRLLLLRAGAVWLRDLNSVTCAVSGSVTYALGCPLPTRLEDPRVDANALKRWFEYIGVRSNITGPSQTCGSNSLHILLQTLVHSFFLQVRRMFVVQYLAPEALYKSPVYSVHRYLVPKPFTSPRFIQYIVYVKLVRLLYFLE